LFGTVSKLTNVVVTGAGGFVGQEVCVKLVQAGYVVRALVRRRAPEVLRCVQTVTVVGDLSGTSNLEKLLADADALVHLAARVHRLGEKTRDVASAYTHENVHMTRVLAEAAQRVGVQRMVFMSSIKALGDRSPDGPFTRSSPPQPKDPYGWSKLTAERELQAVSASMGLGIVVIRAPLVYGAQAGANFREMVKWIRRGVALPLAGVCNRRSVVSVDNLASFVVRCLGPVPDAFNIFHVADPAPVSTPELVGHIAAGLNVAPRLFAVPNGVLETLCRISGRGDIALRLLASLEFETEDSFNVLAWRPATNTRDGIVRAVRGMRLQGN
jgi:UDP-glucose 4-epimerase